MWVSVAEGDKIPTDMKLDGINAIITGGTGGIGKAIASRFLREGSRVLIVARNAAELESTRQEFSIYDTALGTEVCDVSKSEDVCALAEKVQARFGGNVDVLINAAGIYGPKGFLEKTDEKAWLETILVNLYGTMLMTRSVLPMMKKQKSGVVINFSGGGEGAFPRFSAYAASKGGIVRFTESIAEEIREFGIRVNAIAPGAVNSKLLDEALAAGKEKVGEALYHKLLKQKEEGGASPDLAAELCVFLSSDVSRTLTGRVFSAVWDNPTVIEQHSNEIMATDIYTYRRIRPNDRGCEWK